VKQISNSYLIAFLGIGFVAGISSSQLVTGIGQSFPLSPLSLLISLPVIALIMVLATLPIYRYRKKSEKYTGGPRPTRPNPFFAYRALVFSRAVSLTGSLFAGWHLGQLIWLFTFSVAPSQLVLPTIFGLIGGFTMLGGGLIGENNCRAPRDPGEGKE
jgi:hypothetical protein